MHEHKAIIHHHKTTPGLAPQPADLPVQAPVKFDMALNARAANALGLTVPPSIQLLAEEVIQ